MIKQIDKLSSLGVWLSALSCVACFPALASLAAFLGLSILAEFEGIAVNYLLPIFASLALINSLFNCYQKGYSVGSIMMMIGPIMVLLALYPFWQYNWSNIIFYCGLILMLAMSIIDFVSVMREKPCQPSN
jgi:mercuric ion transport protein